MITLLKIVFSVVFVFMCYEVVVTSLQSNLFKEWDFLGGIPWMRATLWDFYANMLAIFCWVCYKEKHVGRSVFWLVLLFCLGSIATSLYMLVKLFALKPGEGVKELLIKQA